MAAVLLLALLAAHMELAMGATARRLLDCPDSSYTCYRDVSATGLRESVSWCPTPARSPGWPEHVDVVCRHAGTTMHTRHAFWPLGPGVAAQATAAVWSESGNWCTAGHQHSCSTWQCTTLPAAVQVHALAELS